MIVCKRSGQTLACLVWIIMILIPASMLGCRFGRQNTPPDITPEPEGAILVNGKPFFPIAIYDGMRHLGVEYSATAPQFAEGDVANKLSILQRMSGAGFNSMRYIPWHGYKYLRDTLFMDMAYSQGIMCWTSIPNNQSTVAWIAQHKGLLMWEIADEPVWQEMEFGPLLRKYETVRDWDPVHSVWMNHAPQNELEEITKYNQACDITGVDIYPFYPIKQHHFPNTEISVVGEYTEWILESVNYEKPAIVVLQGYGLNDEFGQMRPTVHELRFMVYNCIVKGAAGIVFFGTSGMYDGSNWSSVTKVTEELAKLHDVLAVTSVMPYDAVGPVEYLIKQLNSEIYIVAVNTSRGKVKVVFSLPLLQGNLQRLSVLFEDRSVYVDSSEGTFSDWFDGFGVHVYSTKRSLDV
jgi:hypothetical protein